MATAKGPHGGPDRGQGRKAADGATDLVQIGARIPRDQKDKFLALGGSLWLRKKLDEANIETDAVSSDSVRSE